MKAITLILLSGILFSITSCDAIKQATNTTGGAIFSLNGEWQLASNTPENTMVGSVVTVSPFNSEGVLTTVINNSQCYRQKDIKWKNIKSVKTGGFTLDNMLSNCTSGSLLYELATITVISNKEIKLAGKNAAGQDNVQTWTRIK